MLLKQRLPGVESGWRVIVAVLEHQPSLRPIVVFITSSAIRGRANGDRATAHDGLFPGQVYGVK